MHQLSAWVRSPGFLDSGYQGLDRRAARLRLKIEIVKNPSRHLFIPVRERWIVEWSLAWFSANRRLGKRDLEHTVINAETWVQVASISMTLNRLHPIPRPPILRLGGALNTRCLRQMLVLQGWTDD